MNLSNIGGTLSRVGTAALRTLEHYSPKILMAIGIGCGIGGAVTACKATLKLPETMQEINKLKLDIDPGVIHDLALLSRDADPLLHQMADTVEAVAYDATTQDSGDEKVVRE